jgi:hypothetical protein
VEIHNFFITTLCAATSAGARLRAFFASQVLRRGAEGSATFNLEPWWPGVEGSTGSCKGLVTWHANEVRLVGMTPSCMALGEGPLIEETKALSYATANTLGVRLSCATISMSPATSMHGLVCNIGPGKPGSTCMSPTRLVMAWSPGT